jgi:TRAP-type mannitol/chloroaromatic compound transport system permease small subunit
MGKSSEYSRLRSPIDLLLNILVLLPLLLFTLYVSWHVKSRQGAALAREAAESRWWPGRKP